MTTHQHIFSGLLALGLCVGAFSVRAAPGLTVVYPHPESAQDARERYPLQVLRLALDRSGLDYRLQASPTPMQQERSMRELASGRHLDIMWSVDSAERSRRLLSIPFPIDRGLIGWRVLLIRQDDAARFASIGTRAQLAVLVAGQGHDWPDLRVLRENGLAVVASPSYEGLFTMLARHRIDYFPRSVAEVGAEIASHRDLPLALEGHLLLHYPEALHFFVRPGNHVLADAVTRGLRRSIADGSLQRLFDHTYGSLTTQLKLTQRQIIELDDPQAPRESPRDQPGLWFKPGELSP